MNSTQFDKEKSETEIKHPRMTTPITTTIVDSLSSAKEGQLAFPSSAMVSL
jgi:hypothetical protein